MSSWTNVVYTESQAAISALQTGGNWNNGIGPGKPITWQGDSSWIFSATCNPTSQSVWPNMFHSVCYSVLLQCRFIGLYHT